LPAGANDLVLFLQHFSSRTQIFSGESGAFVDELWRRWRARNPDAIVNPAKPRIPPDPSPVIELNRAVAVAMDDGGGTRLIDTILARGDRGVPPGALGAGGPVPAALENRPEIIATADIGCYACRRRETRVPVVHAELA